jgi:hypothetical protein
MFVWGETKKDILMTQSTIPRLNLTTSDKNDLKNSLEPHLNKAWWFCVLELCLKIKLPSVKVIINW